MGIAVMLVGLVMLGASAAVAWEAPDLRIQAILAGFQAVTVIALGAVVLKLGRVERHTSAFHAFVARMESRLGGKPAEPQPAPAPAAHPNPAPEPSAGARRSDGEAVTIANRRVLMRPDGSIMAQTATGVMTFPDVAAFEAYVRPGGGS